MRAGERDPGCDGLDTFQLFVLCARASRAYPTVLSPPTEDVVRFRWETMKIGVAHGERGGERELL